jgi:hypothetical protein
MVRDGSEKVVSSGIGAAPSAVMSTIIPKMKATLLNLASSSSPSESV